MPQLLQGKQTHFRVEGLENVADIRLILLLSMDNVCKDVVKSSVLCRKGDLMQWMLKQYDLRGIERREREGEGREVGDRRRRKEGGKEEGERKKLEKRKREVREGKDRKGGERERRKERERERERERGRREKREIERREREERVRKKREGRGMRESGYENNIECARAIVLDFKILLLVIHYIYSTFLSTSLIIRDLILMARSTTLSLILPFRTSDTSW